MSKTRTLESYTPVNKAGDTMTGDLTLSGGAFKRTMTADGVAIQIKGSYPGNPNLFEVAQVSSDCYAYVRDALGNTAQITGYPSGTTILRGAVRKPEQPKWLYQGGMNPGSSWATITPTDPMIANSNYSTSTGLFTAPVSGTYYLGVWGLLYPADSTDTFTSRFIKNNAQWGSSMGIQGGGNSTNHAHFAAHTLIGLSAGDSCGFQLITGGNGIQAYSTQWSQFGFLVG